MSEKSQTSFFGEKVHDLDEQARVMASKKILVIDDEPAFLDFVRSFLEQTGYSVDVATDGVQGVKKIMVNDYSVILCDMVMPNLSGEMFYVAVERVKPHLCKRFIFMTGFNQDPKIDAFIRRIRGLILWKPFQLHVLIESIQAVQKKSGEA